MICHVMPKIFHKFCWWKTSSCWRILAALFQISLAYMAVETIREVYRSSLILRLSVLDRHTSIYPYFKQTQSLQYFLAEPNWIYLSHLQLNTANKYKIQNHTQYHESMSINS